MYEKIDCRKKIKNVYVTIYEKNECYFSRIVH